MDKTKEKTLRQKTLRKLVQMWEVSHSELYLVTVKMVNDLKASLAGTLEQLFKLKEATQNIKNVT